MNCIGIDLGTTNSLISIYRDGISTLIPNPLGKTYTPSVVAVDGDTIIVGDIAKEKLITNPKETAANFKRFMGTKKEFKLGSHTFKAEELSSFILKSLKSDAEAFLGEEVKNVVISVPAYFNDSQRKATKIAGELAGLTVDRLISEPTAAALAYGMQDKPDESKFLVFDLGGGTFDVSVLEHFEGIMDVKSIAGDNFLGGEDFTTAIKNYFIKEKKLKVENLSNIELSIIHKEAELAKQALTNNEIATMNVNINNSSRTLSLSRDMLEDICANVIERLKIPIARALKDANLNRDDLDAIILIGGSSKMPLIRSIVSTIFKKFPYTQINPDEAVALGASIQAALKAKNIKFDEMILTDVCPYTLGTAVFNPNGDFLDSNLIFAPIIERNTPIPVSKFDYFTPANKESTSVIISIYQGESRYVKDNLKLGEIELPLSKNPDERHFISVRFSYDINGLLEIEVNNANNKQSLVIEKSPGVMTELEIQESLKRLEKLKIPPREKQENSIILARALRLYEETIGETRKYLSDLISQFENILNSQNDTRIEDARERLSGILDSIEGASFKYD